MINRGNSVAAIKRNEIGLADEMAAMDRLPQSIRRALMEAPISISAGAALQHFTWASSRLYGAQAERATLDVLEASCADELAAFASKFRARFGMLLPHVAARAGRQRYGKWGPAQSRRGGRMRRIMPEGMGY